MTRVMHGARVSLLVAGIVLADEINRAPAKTQSALLEAMEEHQVTVEGETRRLDDPFFVIATSVPQTSMTSIRDVPTTPFNFLLANQDMSLQTDPPNKKARYFSIGLVFQSDQNKFPENCPPLRAAGV